MTASFSAFFKRPCSSPTRNFGKYGFAEALVFRGRGLQLLFRFLDHRIEHVGLAATRDFAAHEFPHTGQLPIAMPSASRSECGPAATHRSPTNRDRHRA